MSDKLIKFKYFAIWFLIMALIIGIYAYRGVFVDFYKRIKNEIMPGNAWVQKETNEVIIQKSVNGHFFIRAVVNNEKIKFLVDTGASRIMLSPSDARKLGYNSGDLNFTEIYHTANGKVRGAPIRLDYIRVGNIEFENIRASVNGAHLEESLLGMDFLRRLSSYRFEGDSLIISQQ